MKIEPGLHKDGKPKYVPIQCIMTRNTVGGRWYPSIYLVDQMGQSGKKLGRLIVYKNLEIRHQAPKVTVDNAWAGRVMVYRNCYHTRKLKIVGKRGMGRYVYRSITGERAIDDKPIMEEVSKALQCMMA